MVEAEAAVIGGAGFPGLHIVLQLLEAGYTSIALARRPEVWALATVAGTRQRARFQLVACQCNLSLQDE